MTNNQHHAVDLAKAVVEKRVKPSNLSDDDWALLMLAADQCDSHLPAQPVAQQALDQFDQDKGYFAATGTSAEPTGGGVDERVKSKE